MRGYTPFPIYNLRAGLNLSAEPWMIPEQAFQTAQNVYFYNGRVFKRKGYTTFAQGTLLWDIKITAGENQPAVGDQIVSATETAGATFVSASNTAGAWATNDWAGTIRVASATAPGYLNDEALTNDTQSNALGDADGTAWAKGVNWLTSDVMGIYEFFTTAGASHLIVFDTDYLYEYDETNEVFIGEGGWDDETPDFTGTDEDFMWCENIGKGQLGAVDDLLIITNNTDVLKAWNGSTLTDLDAATMPDSALFVVQHKNRLVMLNTTEAGVRYPQRARCTNAGTYSSADDDIYTDADTIDWINGVAFVRGELMVLFERSVWWLRYTGDPQNPFGWVKIAETEGCYAPFSVVNFEDEVVALGPTSFVACDGLSVYNIDEKVPDLVLQMNQDNLSYAYGLMIDELRQYICSYPGLGSTYSNKILALNYVDNAFSIYDLPMHSAGYWTVSGTQTINQTNEVINSVGRKIDDVTKTAGYPMTLMGDTSGNVRELFTTDADNGAAIGATLKTKRLVPYQNKKAKLGYIDIIGDSGSALTLTLKVYKDYSASAFFTQSVSMYEAGKEKTIQRIRVMERGQSFEIEISDGQANNPIVIDAIIPYFKEAGNLK